MRSNAAWNIKLVHLLREFARHEHPQPLQFPNGWPKPRLLKDRLVTAKSYCRVAGYFRSSAFELVHEQLESIDSIQIVCNSDLDPKDIQASRLARETAIKEKWNEGFDEIDTLVHRKRYQQVYGLLKSGNVDLRVVSAAAAPFLHGKACIIEGRDGSKTSFIGSMIDTCSLPQPTLGLAGRTV